MLINQFGTSIHIPSVTTVKIEPNDNNVLVLLDSDDVVCLVIIFLIHHLFLIELGLCL